MGTDSFEMFLDLLTKVIAMILPFFPLFFLLTSLGSVLWYKKTANDIFGALALSSALVGIIWSLVIVHWSILLLSLILLLGLKVPILSVIQVQEHR